MILQEENETLSDAIERWKSLFDNYLDVKKDEKTRQNYVNVVEHLLKFVKANPGLESIKFENINHKLFDDYFDYRDQKRFKEVGKKLASTTKRNDKKVLRIFLDYIEGVLDDEVTFSVKWKRIALGNVQRKEVDIYQDDMIDKILKYLEKNIKKHRNEFSYMLSFTIKLCLFGGLRASEVCKVSFKDFGQIYTTKNTKKKIIPLKIKGKNETEFTNPIPYEYIKNEFNYFKRNKPNEKFLFQSIKGENLNRYHLYRYLEDVAAELEINKNSLHSLRRTYATKLASHSSNSIFAIKELMRHTDIKTTSIYLARNQNQMDDAVSKL